MVIGPGTLYSLLDSFLTQGFIRETGVEGRRRSYRITPAGERRLEEEYRRLLRQAGDYEARREGETQ